MTISSYRQLMARHAAVTGDTFFIAALKRNIGDGNISRTVLVRSTEHQK